MICLFVKNSKKARFQGVKVTCFYLGIKKIVVRNKMTKKTFVLIRHFYCTKIQLLFEPAILSTNIFSFSIFFLINQIA